MCQSNAYFYNNGEKELFMEDVSEVIPEEGGITLKGMLGEKKYVKASLKKLALMDHEIIMERE